eukprot:5065506-Lingulodinium_polyedra.AAC.1
MALTFVRLASVAGDSTSAHPLEALSKICVVWLSLAPMMCMYIMAAVQPTARFNVYRWLIDSATMW